MTTTASGTGHAQGIGGFLGFTLGITSLGAAVGYFVALSASPVIAVLLPLLFGLLGGGGLFALLKVDISKPVHRQKLNIAGTAVGSFCVALLVSSAGFILLKNSDFLKEERRPEQIALFKGLTLDQAVAIAAERMALRNLGASSSEEGAALEKLIDSTKEETARRVSGIASLSQGLDAGSLAAEKAATVVAAATFPDEAQLGDAKLSEWQSSIRPVLNYSTGLLRKCAGQVQSTSALPLSCDVYLRFLISKFESMVGSRTMVPDSDLTMLSAYPEILDALMQFQDALETASARLQSLTPVGFDTTDSQTTERVNKILENIFRYEQQSQSESDLSKFFAVMDRPSGVM